MSDLDLIPDAAAYRDFLVYASVCGTDFPEEDFPGLSAEETVESVIATLASGLRLVGRYRDDESVREEADRLLAEASAHLREGVEWAATRSLQRLEWALWDR